MPRSTVTLYALVAIIAIFVIYRFVGSYTPLSTNESITPIEDKGAYGEWKEFTAPTEKFKALFPLHPRHVAESSQDPYTQSVRRYNIYVSEQLDSTIYMITSVNFTEKFNPEKDDRILTNTVTDMVSSNGQNALVSMDETTFQGRKSVKFQIDNGKTNHIEGITFVADKTLYILTRISKKGNVNDEEFERFIRSFQLIPSALPAAAPQPITPTQLKKI